jgi:hypothetical protein
MENKLGRIARLFVSALFQDFFAVPRTLFSILAVSGFAQDITEFGLLQL